MTLNQLIDKIQALGNAHEMIATTFNGPVMDRLALGDVTYPLMTFDTNTARIVGSDASYDFQMFFIDRLVADSENEREVQSDQMSILQDIIAQLRYPGWDWTVDGTANVQMITDSTPDLLAGVAATITITLPYQSDRCQVPSELLYPAN